MLQPPSHRRQPATEGRIRVRKPGHEPGGPHDEGKLGRQIGRGRGLDTGRGHQAGTEAIGQVWFEEPLAGIQQRFPTGRVAGLGGFEAGGGDPQRLLAVNSADRVLGVLDAIGELDRLAGAPRARRAALAGIGEPQRCPVQIRGPEQVLGQVLEHVELDGFPSPPGDRQGGYRPLGKVRDPAEQRRPGPRGRPFGVRRIDDGSPLVGGHREHRLGQLPEHRGQGGVVIVGQRQRLPVRDIHDQPRPVGPASRGGEGHLAVGAPLKGVPGQKEHPQPGRGPGLGGAQPGPRQLEVEHLLLPHRRRAFNAIPQEDPARDSGAAIGSVRRSVKLMSNAGHRVPAVRTP